MLYITPVFRPPVHASADAKAQDAAGREAAILCFTAEGGNVRQYMDGCCRERHPQVQNIENIGRRKAFSGKVELTPQEYHDLTSLAKEGVASRGTIHKLREQLRSLQSECSRLREKLDEIIAETKAYCMAFKLAPQKVMEFLKGIIRESQQKRHSRHQDRQRER